MLVMVAHEQIPSEPACEIKNKLVISVAGDTALWIALRLSACHRHSCLVGIYGALHPICQRRALLCKLICTT